MHYEELPAFPRPLEWNDLYESRTYESRTNFQERCETHIVDGIGTVADHLKTFSEELDPDLEMALRIADQTHEIQTAVQSLLARARHRGSNHAPRHRGLQEVKADSGRPGTSTQTKRKGEDPDVVWFKHAESWTDQRNTANKISGPNGDAFLA